MSYLVKNYRTTGELLDKGITCSMGLAADQGSMQYLGIPPNISSSVRCCLSVAYAFNDKFRLKLWALTVIAPPPVPKLLNYIKQINFKSEFVIKSIRHRQTAPHRAWYQRQEVEMTKKMSRLDKMQQNTANNLSMLIYTAVMSQNSSYFMASRACRHI